MRNIFIFCLAALLLVACEGRNNRKQSVLTSEKTEGTPPSESTGAVARPAKPTVNVYIENSGSMDGYVKGVTEFERAVYSYLSDIKKENVAKELNLFYINSEIFKQPDDVEEFINKLEPNSFKKKGGNRTTSDIPNVIKSMLAKTGENDIAMLITDGIFSPGRKDAKEYLDIQEIGIKVNTSKHLEKYPNTAAIVYQLFSKFSGIYYNNEDKYIRLNNVQRPYYIYIFGQVKNLAELRRKIPESSFGGGGVKKMFSISAENQQIDYAVKRGSGRFDMPRNSKTEIINLKKDRRGEVKFAITANFENLLLDEDYLTNPNNYEVQKYRLTVKRDAGSEKYTLTLYSSDNKPHKGAVTLKLKMATPDWSGVNDDNGSTAVAGKTFGIKYQIQGLFNAYTHPGKQAYYAEFKVNIK